MTAARIEEYVGVFISVFTKEPWNDVYESRGQVRRFFENYMADNYFLGFSLERGGACAGLCFGARKPWLGGMEYWIDQFCVAEDFQRRGAGTLFLSFVEEQARRRGLNGIMLATARPERDYARDGARLPGGEFLSQKRLSPPRRHRAAGEIASRRAT